MKRKVLVVDDDEDAVELLRFILEKAGFQVGTSRNGAEALRKICSFSPDLIVLDVMMPEVDGFAVCDLVRGNELTAKIPIIMLTAMAGDLPRVSALEAGVSEYMTKPFSPKEMVHKVEHLLCDNSPIR